LKRRIIKQILLKVYVRVSRCKNGKMLKRDRIRREHAHRCAGRSVPLAWGNMSPAAWRGEKSAGTGKRKEMGEIYRLAAKLLKNKGVP